MSSGRHRRCPGKSVLHWVRTDVWMEGKKSNISVILQNQVVGTLSCLFLCALQMPRPALALTFKQILHYLLETVWGNCHSAEGTTEGQEQREHLFWGYIDQALPNKNHQGKRACSSLISVVCLPLSYDLQDSQPLGSCVTWEPTAPWQRAEDVPSLAFTVEMEKVGSALTSREHGDPLVASPAGVSRGPLIWIAVGWLLPMELGCAVSPVFMEVHCGGRTSIFFFPVDTMERLCELRKCLILAKASSSPLFLLTLHINRDQLGLYQLPNVFKYSDLSFTLSTMVDSGSDPQYLLLQQQLSLA